MNAIDQRQIEEALYVYRRYATEIVEELKLCPWALPARKAGRVREEVILMDTPDAVAAARYVNEIARDEQIEIGLLIFPRLALARMDFERFAKAVREEDGQRHPNGGAPLAMAAFHPDALPDLASAERLTPFLRCTPDPTIQLVRTSALEKVRASDEHGSSLIDVTKVDWNLILQSPPKAPMHERIAEMNLATVKEIGVAEIQKKLADIRADRDRRYASLLGA